MLLGFLNIHKYTLHLLSLCENQGAKVLTHRPRCQTLTPRFASRDCGAETKQNSDRSRGPPLGPQRGLVSSWGLPLDRWMVYNEKILWGWFRARWLWKTSSRFCAGFTGDDGMILYVFIASSSSSTMSGKSAGNMFVLPPSANPRIGFDSIWSFTYAPLAGLMRESQPQLVDHFRKAPRFPHMKLFAISMCSTRFAHTKLIDIPLTLSYNLYIWKNVRSNETHNFPWYIKLIKTVLTPI